MISDESYMSPEFESTHKEHAVDCIQHDQPSNGATGAENEVIDAMQRLPQRTGVSATFNCFPPLNDRSCDKILID